MFDSIPEADWKIFRELRVIALDRFCQRVLDRIVQTANDQAQIAHERYLSIFKIIEREDDDLAVCFNAASRGHAMMQLGAMRQRRLLTDAEFARFSADVREKIESMLRGFGD